MNYNSVCPVCSNRDQLTSLKWRGYNIIHCNNCELDYCGEMNEKEIGGDSSPVNLQGIKMMSDLFYRTSDLAISFASRRKIIYEDFLNRPCKKVLEVGCGPGVFYKPWRDLNVEWTGTDINSYWKDFGKKNRVPISNESIDSIINKYDVVMAHQVIEHVEDPLKFMKRITELLEPGGIIHLELPNQNSLTAKLRKISPSLSHDYGFIQPPMHLRAYTEKTINYLYKRLNLSSEMIFVCGNTDHTWGQVREYSFFQKSLYTISNTLGMGSLLIGIAQKK
ncbi:MAG: hypothetical protein CMG74_10275 [Candidatus Marinimicrobia bacterium]|nr:hypothetical protein [Candidatus Neomarinimicrobiota bacterium]|tara:strand:+ start:2582 stop:3415 length:834 start_codon:yes stop_codon:yes gene_type:complete